jgi:hypothetical protein
MIVTRSRKRNINFIFKSLNVLQYFSIYPVLAKSYYVKNKGKHEGKDSGFISGNKVTHNCEYGYYTFIRCGGIKQSYG